MKGARTEAQRIADAGQHFAGDTEGFQMRVVLDEGLHRHLQFRGPRGTSLYWFDIHTSPGLLVFHGDAGNWMFSRVQDMFTFFRGGPVNPGYWGEKVIANDRNSKPQTYDRLLLLASLKRHALQYAETTWEQPDPEFAEPDDDWQERRAGFYRDVITDLIRSDELEFDYASEQAVGLLMSWEYLEPNAIDATGRRTSRNRWHRPFDEAWDWGPHTAPDHLFLWCCHAIVWGIEQYDAAKAVPV